MLIPLPVVRLNRWTIVVVVLLGFALRAPILTTVLFLIIAPTVIFGRRASLIYQLGSRLFPTPASNTEGEDPGLMRFNNTLAAVMLGVAQIAFLFHADVIGWTLAALTALAAAVALAGFCVGCFLYYQFKLNARPGGPFRE